MTSYRTDLRPNEPSSTPSVTVSLTKVQVEALRDVAHHYERVMGVARHMVVMTSGRRIRARYRHIVQESSELEALAVHWLEATPAEGQPVQLIELSLHDAISFWGRLLSNLKTKRSRRKLSKEQVAAQEEVEKALSESVAVFWPPQRANITSEMNTRRRREREWMLSRLTGEDVMH